MLIDFPTLPELPGGPIVALVVGALLVIAGRRLFWLAVGTLGFLFGFDLAQGLVGADSETLALVLGIGGGLLGIVLAIFLQKIAIAFAGFLAGGMLAVGLFGGAGGMTEALVFLVGGLITAFLALWLFEFALIFLSSLAGAYLIVGALTLEAGLEAIILVVAVVAGVAIQMGFGGRRRRRRVAREA